VPQVPVSLPLGDASLVAPVPGLMIWTLVAFLVTLWLLKKFALGRIAAAIEDRRQLVRENLEASEHARDEANRLLEEYKAQLAASRREATEIVERARRTGEELSRQLREEANAQREKDIAAAKSAIEAETRQSLDRIKQEVADLTLLATEKVVGRTLDGAEQKRLIDEALAEVDFAALAGPAEDG
jgi:F-type H+-transporting ATPase subunit b